MTVVNIALCYFVHKSRRVGYLTTFVARKKGVTVPPPLCCPHNNVNKRIQDPAES